MTVLLVLSVCLLLATLAVVLLAVFFVLKAATQLPGEIPLPHFLAKSSQDQITPDYADPTVPLEDFTPDPKRPLKVKYVETKDGIEEVLDES